MRSCYSYFDKIMFAEKTARWGIGILGEIGGGGWVNQPASQAGSHQFKNGRGPRALHCWGLACRSEQQLRSTLPRCFYWIWTSGDAVQLIQRNRLFGRRQGWLTLLSLSADYNYNYRRIYSYKLVRHKSSNVGIGHKSSNVDILESIVANHSANYNCQRFWIILLSC